MELTSRGRKNKIKCYRLDSSIGQCNGITAKHFVSIGFLLLIEVWPVVVAFDSVGERVGFGRLQKHTKISFTKKKKDLKTKQNFDLITF